MDCVEEVDELPRSVNRGRGRARSGRSQFFRKVMEQFMASDAKFWHVIKDYDGTPITPDKIGRLYSQFYQIVRSEYSDEKVSIVMRNYQIYIVKEQKGKANEQH